jgi:hypothetical protein
MKTINPIETQEMVIAARASAVNLLCVQAERLQEWFIKKREIKHDLFRRVIESVFRISAHMKMDAAQGQSFEAKFSKAGTGDMFSVNVEDKRVYIEGYFDLNRLKQEFLW